MAKAAKSTRKPAKAKKAVGTKKAARKKVVSKKKTPAKAKVASRKKPAKKKAVVKKKASPKKAAPAKRKPAKTRTQVEVAKPKAAAVVAHAPDAAVAKPSKSRLIKAQPVDIQVELLPPALTPSLLAETQAEDSLLHVGEMAPDFELRADDGSIVALSDFHGRKVVLYFYPKDDTPGCTVEACSFRDGLVEIEEHGAVVLGVSVDPVESHQMFRDKLGLNFPLLSDENKEVVQAYGVWKERTHDGRTYMTTERTTFVIGEDGRIARIFPKVQVHGHFEEVLAAVEDVR